MISVIIPTYNHGKALWRCLLSLAEQSVLPGEVIIIDDESTDGTEGYVARYLKNPCLSHLRMSYKTIKHAGAPTARNTGAALATGDYLLFLDADIICQPEMFALCADALAHAPAASYAYGAFRFGRKLFHSQKFDAEKLKQGNYIHTSALMRKDHFPGFDESLKRFQDWDLWLTMLERGHTGVFIDQVLFRARVGLFRKGISQWKPKLVYKLWQTTTEYFDWAPRWYRAYQQARQLVMLKHKLSL
ncbi:MAG: glycosyltransferase family A protein [Patescibacteria group bacterium]|jgi:glycosyltransferase involved in cell wall biosynthesis